MAQQQEALAAKKGRLANPQLNAEQEGPTGDNTRPRKKRWPTASPKRRKGWKRRRDGGSLTATLIELAKQEEQLRQGKSQFEAAREEAYKQADMGTVITEAMIGQILAAENFSMPAGS